MLVRQVMNRNVVTASPDTSVAEAARVMADNTTECIVATRGTDIIGILTERDIIRFIAEMQSCDEIETRKISDIMTDFVLTVTADSTVEAAVRLMHEHKVRRLPVLEDDVLAGIITASDIVYANPNLMEVLRKKGRF